MAVFRKNRGLNIRFYVQNPQKAHPCTEPRLLTYFAWRSVLGPRLWARGRTQKNEHLGVIFHAYGEKKPLVGSTQKLCTTGDIRDVITPANFGFDRFRGFSVASGQILGFSIGFRRRPYNTLALSCECVIITKTVVVVLSTNACLTVKTVDSYLHTLHLKMTSASRNVRYSSTIR